MMGRNREERQNSTRGGLIVGSYCHDVLFRDGAAVTESLGGAASFISVVLDGLSVSYKTVSKVGPDFAYRTSRKPLVIPTSKTTLFHAYFDSKIDDDGRRRDRVLRRVSACDPIRPSDLPETRFDFGMAAGVAGEVMPETLEAMLEICDVVFVDIQALIREFDDIDGTVRLVSLKESGFYHLLPRISFLKASAEEAPYMDIEEVRKMCCVVVTNGKHGCKLYGKDGDLQIAPFLANQVDPTGAGDSFLGGLASGLVQGLTVSDAALLGNLFGSLTVEQIGLPRFDSRLLQRIKDEVQKRKTQCVNCFEWSDDRFKIWKPVGHEQFHSSLEAAKAATACPLDEDQLLGSPKVNGNGGLLQCTEEPKLLVGSVYGEPIPATDTNP